MSYNAAVRPRPNPYGFRPWWQGVAIDPVNHARHECIHKHRNRVTALRCAERMVRHLAAGRPA